MLSQGVQTGVGINIYDTSIAGATHTPINFIVNGNPSLTINDSGILVNGQPISGSGTVVGPNTSTPANFACWSNSIGTLLRDCGPQGSASSVNTGTSGHTLGFLDGNNTFSGTDNFTGTLQVNGVPVGTVSNYNIGTTGATVPLNNGGFTQSGAVNFTNGFNIGGFQQTFPSSGLISDGSAGSLPHLLSKLQTYDIVNKPNIYLVCFGSSIGTLTDSNGNTTCDNVFTQLTNAFNKGPNSRYNFAKDNESVPGTVMDQFSTAWSTMRGKGITPTVCLLNYGENDFQAAQYNAAQRWDFAKGYAEAAAYTNCRAAGADVIFLTSHHYSIMTSGNAVSSLQMRLRTPRMPLLKKHCHVAVLMR